MFGGGGLAREVLSAIRLLPEDWKPIGALDDDPIRHLTHLDGLPVLGGLELRRELTDVAPTRTGRTGGSASFGDSTRPTIGGPRLYIQRPPLLKAAS